MKKLLFFALALLCVGAAFAQSLPRVAVYVTGKVDEGDKKVVASKLLLAITKSEEYLAVERMDKFLAELNKEHAYQQSGAVDDRHIIAVGKKWGANFVCIAEASKVYGSTFVSARLVRVITGEVAVVAEGKKKVSEIEDIDEIAVTVAEELFGVTLPKASSGGKTERPQGSNSTPAAYSDSKASAGLTIGNVTWAAANVDDYQTFAPRPDMYTKFYQWNRSKAWSATAESVSGWETDITDPEWTINPCPAGWRLPTWAEFQALDRASGGSGRGYYSNGGTWANANTRGNAVAGRFYGPNHATASLPDNMVGCVFFPASGTRSTTNGALSTQGVWGYGWSSSQESSANGYSLSFSSTGSSPALDISKSYGFPVRCVQ